MIRSMLLSATLVAGICGAEIADPVRLDAGSVSGLPVVEGVRAFMGIPFGAPPVGDLRWRSPRPVTRWEGVREATEFGDVCIQPPGQGRLNIAVLPDGPGMSEDCLYLNVWTPAGSAADALPVMLYIYGGAFTEGAGSVPLYDGTELARKGAVIVTMNYRLGAFGFLAHPELTRTSSHGYSGNYGDEPADLRLADDGRGKRGWRERGRRGRRRKLRGHRRGLERLGSGRRRGCQGDGGEQQRCRGGELGERSDHGRTSGCVKRVRRSVPRPRARGTT
jgi:hypothetical protein